MRIIDKDWKYGTRKAYEDVPAELNMFAKGVRVLPADMFYENGLFTFISKHEPGEPGWSEGGFELYDDGGGKRNYYLDQVILHPQVINHRPTLRMIKGIDEADKESKHIAKALRDPNAPAQKRGRKPLDPEEKARREEAKAEQATRSGGKRGRPAIQRPEGYVAPVKVLTGGKRGRKPLDPAVKAEREQMRLAASIKSGGKRGRPKKS